MSANVCIIVPCYNEANRFRKNCFVKFAAANPFVHFVLVNDGSADSTLAVITELAGQIPGQFQVLNLPQNVGKSEAVRKGILRALDSDYAYVGFWDADLATPLMAIPEFHRILDSRADIDLVIGTRLPLLGRKIERKFIRQKIGSCCGTMASLALGTRIRDTQCGAKLFRVTQATRYAFQSSFHSRWLFDVEVFARLIQVWNSTDDRKFKQRVFELPLQHWHEVPGSSLKRMDFLKAGLELMQIYRRYISPFASKPDLTDLSIESAPTIPLDKKRAA